jgi:hypothetical protein
MTRADFLMEVLERMDLQEMIARRNGREDIAYDYVVGKRLLRTLYRSDELIDLEWLAHISEYSRF